MAPPGEMQTAMINRSIRAIKAELEFLTDASVITPQTLSELLSRIPEQTALHAPISVGAVPTTAIPAPSAPQQPPRSPAPAMQNLSLNEKQEYYGNPSPSPAPLAAATMPPPPAYNAAPSMPPLAHAVAMYAYHGEDAGDLDLAPNDQIAVTEYMNAEWWKGRSARTGQEGIFPRSYVRVEENKNAAATAAATGGGSNGAGGYGDNLPMQTSGMGNGQGQVPGKGQEMGKKFGKKLGNAAIFGAGATIGGNIVNSIF